MAKSWCRWSAPIRLPFIAAKALTERCSLEHCSLNHFDFRAGSEAPVITERNFVHFELPAMPLQGDRRMYGEQVVAPGDGDVVIVNRHRSGMHGEIAGQAVGFEGDASDSAGRAVDVNQTVKADAD